MDEDRCGAFRFVIVQTVSHLKMMSTVWIDKVIDHEAS